MLTEVADGVLVHRSELLRNNTVVVRGPSGALLVDPGVTRAELERLTSDLRDLGDAVVAGFATHPDWDHALWHPGLGDAPRYGTARCAASLQQLRSAPDWRDTFVQGLPPEIADETPVELFGLVTALPADAVEVPWDGPRVRVLEHPAHAPGHAALLVERARVLVAGDMLSDVFVPMLDDPREGSDPLADHLTGLQRLADVAGEADVVVPGHGSVGDARELRARLAADLAYVRALRDGRPTDDPRVLRPEPGWEWVADLHEGQVRTWAPGRGRG
ncbi:MBL fold metallo-hydrolase [Kineococcus sp. SYSU DK004]|uniref:MBL fold metallo-hydrolase n=1 Tax=Kineococcus sp. SYSU DK004 TaxID=3383125 RepID=UPI003D7D8AD2